MLNNVHAEILPSDLDSTFNLRRSLNRTVCCTVMSQEKFFLHLFGLMLNSDTFHTFSSIQMISDDHKRRWRIVLLVYLSSVHSAGHH